MWLEDVSWSNPPKDREEQRTVLNTRTVINARINKEWGISEVAEQLLPSLECLCSVVF
jgi:hypothetical protein